MNETDKTHSVVVNTWDVPEVAGLSGTHHGCHHKSLTPAMRVLGGMLGVNHIRLPPGRVVCPFHRHQREDEVFYILSGVGTLRYGDSVKPLGKGDCVSCPAGTDNAHQIANTGTEDLVYLAIGNHDPQEVCDYPDSGKVMVRSLSLLGRATRTEYLDGEAEVPGIFAMVTDAKR